MGRFISDAAKRALDLLCVVLGGPFVLGIAAYTRHRIKKIAQAMPFTLASGWAKMASFSHAINFVACTLMVIFTLTAW